MPIQNAAVSTPVRSSIRRRRFLRTATIITPMAQSKKPNSGQNIAELNLSLEALAGSCNQKDANEVAAVSDAATQPASAKPFAHSGTTQSFFVSRQSSQVCATTNAATIKTNSATSPSPSTYHCCSLKTSQRRRRFALRSENSVAGHGAKTARGPLLPNHILSARPLLPVATLLLRQTPLLLSLCIALLANQVLLAPSALAWLELRCCLSVRFPRLLRQTLQTRPARCWQICPRAYDGLNSLVKINLSAPTMDTATPLRRRI